MSRTMSRRHSLMKLKVLNRQISGSSVRSSSGCWWLPDMH